MKWKGKNNITRFFSQEKHRLLCSYLVAETAEQHWLDFKLAASVCSWNNCFETVWKFAQTELLQEWHWFGSPSCSWQRTEIFAFFSTKTCNVCTVIQIHSQLVKTSLNTFWPSGSFYKALVLGSQWQWWLWGHAVKVTTPRLDKHFFKLRPYI